ncbi:MAG: hypothetical protein ACKN9K_07865, partial [Dolichospermum sp.]
QAIAQYAEVQYLESQRANRQLIQEKFAEYLLANIGKIAVDWLQLYLQGKSQEQIAKQLNKPIKEIYRLREKISYHAVRIFAIKRQPELVDNWLSTSLQDDNLGLTATEWQQLEEQLTPLAQQVLNLRKAGNSIEEIAQKLQCKTVQILSEWTKIYLAAQSLRTNIIIPKSYSGFRSDEV